MCPKISTHKIVFIVKHDTCCTDNPNICNFRMVGSHRRMSKAGSHTSLTRNRQSSSVHHGGVPATPRDEAAAAAAAAMTLNSRLGPVAEASMLPRETYYGEHIDTSFKNPHLQVCRTFSEQIQY